MEKPKTENNDMEILDTPDNYMEKLKNAGLEKHAEAYETVLQIAEAIKSEGGAALLVGGSVRDICAGKISKDYDIEIYGLEADKIEKIANRFGKVSEVGKAFGILKLSLPGGLDIDLSLPRTDSKISAGHGGFKVKTDPNMPIEDAARRRDFTINSMAMNPLTGELHNPFGGKEDLKNRILKITDPERFKDDPLRVMRALQFIGRFGLSLDKDSIPVIMEMTKELKELPKERIFEEWKKLLLKSKKPSLGLTAGMSLGVLKEIHPEFPPMAETPQEPEWHPEGDVWIHTLMCVDEAAKAIRQEDIESDSDEALTIMLGALCHDLGKQATTEIKEGRIKSHGHESAGEEPAKKFLATLGAKNIIRDKVAKITVNHLAPSMLYITDVIKGEKVSDGAFRRLAQRIHPATIRELVLVVQSDHLGR